ncbi:hypothetical protein TKV_c24240 [Thermoanaerobacter kivui]|uniref:XapX domain-containing protein n=1 Tax=Thermoanaerobacter kivui TaxID=2325 RepID=A0A097AUN3_THEKI|nr:XapX domain-containing protein [Thermoanaerobacter kivui]AIS53544.1 hypothetical protein TKV_c24240 [Thermoanaerobacter kivui]
MKATLLALVTGIIVGLIFSFLKLPLPAPNVLPGVAGIIGIYLGGVFFEYIIKLIGK